MTVSKIHMVLPVMPLLALLKGSLHKDMKHAFLIVAHKDDLVLGH